MAAERTDVAEARLVGRLAPLHRAWVREFLQTTDQRRSAATRRKGLRALVHFDRFLTDQSDVGEGQWSLVTPDHVHAHLAQAGRYHLYSAKAFLVWLYSRKRTDHRLAQALPDPHRPLRVRLLSTDELAACYRSWTAEDAHPTAALVGLLALVHCLRNSEIRRLRVADVRAPDQLQVGTRVISLAHPVADALHRYLAWRSEHYAGPSTYLLVSRGSRLHDRPVSAGWFAANLLGTPVANLRQSAIQHLIQASGCDGLQLAAYADLSIDAVGIYMRAFGTMAAWPPSAVR